MRSRCLRFRRAACLGISALRRAVGLDRPACRPLRWKAGYRLIPTFNDPEANPLWSGMLGNDKVRASIHAFNRRGCVTLAIVAGLFSLFLIAIGLSGLAGADR